MKIFISHSSKNLNYGSALVELLTGIGIPHESIVFTSDTSYGIPTSENIFDWLKNRITEKPFVIFLLSPQYYASVACLNEMGAAWVIENEHVMIFTPDFDLTSDSFRDGALDPRRIGFFLNDEDRLTEFIERLRLSFTISNNQVVVNKKRREFLNNVAEFQSKATRQEKKEVETQLVPKHSLETSRPTPNSKEDFLSDFPHRRPPSLPVSSPVPSRNRKRNPVERYFTDMEEGKLKDVELMIIYYAADTAGAKLGVGWRTDGEVNKIKSWEELNELGDTLSSDYQTAISRLELRNLTTVSETTSHNNPREVMLIAEMKEKLLELPDVFYTKCEEISKRCLQEKQKRADDIPW